MRLVRTLRGRLVVIAMVWCGLFLFCFWLPACRP